MLRVLLAAAAAFSVGAAVAAGDAKRGEQLYARCAACHALAYDRVGPRHCDLLGRRAGGVPGFDYSAAMKKSGIVWTAATLDRFLANPMRTVPGTTMTYAGVADAGERADLIAYLGSTTCDRSRQPSWTASIEIVLIGALLAGYVAYRLAQRWLFLRSLRTARISVHELSGMIDRGEDPIVLDVRTRSHRLADGRRIPGARAVDLDALERTLGEVPREREVVVYCACPSEATAAKVALRLRARGFRRVRPLAGGIDEWVSAGFAVDSG